MPHRVQDVDARDERGHDGGESRAFGMTFGNRTNPTFCDVRFAAIIGA
jgi:hypothetical protein